ncbi:MAG: hypothetical protein AAGJ74_05115 [Pseudomonadota bacterium]
MRPIFALPLAMLFVASSAEAACRIAGAKCLTPEKRAEVTRYAVGEALPRGKYTVLLNTEYYGLPPTDGTFWYFKVDRRVLKVEPQTMEVLEDVTRAASRAVW